MPELDSVWLAQVGCGHAREGTACSVSLLWHLNGGEVTTTSPENITRASLVAQTVKHLPAMWETWVRSLGWEDPLDKEMATHSSTLAWKIPWMEEPGRLQSMGLQRVGHN